MNRIYMEKYLVPLTHTVLPTLQADHKINDWPWVGYALAVVAYTTVVVIIIFAFIVVGRLIWLMIKTF